MSVIGYFILLELISSYYYDRFSIGFSNTFGWILDERLM